MQKIKFTRDRLVRVCDELTIGVKDWPAIVEYANKYYDTSFSATMQEITFDTFMQIYKGDLKIGDITSWVVEEFLMEFISDTKDEKDWHIEQWDVEDVNYFDDIKED